MHKLILGYHGVEKDGNTEPQWIEYGQRRYNLTELSVKQSLFEKQLNYLRKKGKNVVITFDDGFKNFFTLARPILKKYNYTATIFLVTDKIGTEHFLSWDEIEQLKEQGFSFGVHTCSHTSLTSLRLEQAKQEIEESKKIIEEKINAPVELFSYPYGDFNPAIQNLVKEAGFLGAVATPSKRGLKQGPFAMKRIGINRNNSMLVFKFKASKLFDLCR